MPPNKSEPLGEASEIGKKLTSKRPVSDAALRAAKPTDKAYKLAAGGGLYLEITPGGSKLWRWKYRLHGKENRYTLGNHPNLSLKEARGRSGFCPPISQAGNSSGTTKAARSN